MSTLIFDQFFPPQMDTFRLHIDEGSLPIWHRQMMVNTKGFEM